MELLFGIFVLGFRQQLLYENTHPVTGGIPLKGTPAGKLESEVKTCSCIAPILALTLGTHEQDMCGSEVSGLH